MKKKLCVFFKDCVGQGGKKDVVTAIPELVNKQASPPVPARRTTTRDVGRIGKVCDMFWLDRVKAKDGNMDNIE